VTPTAPRPRHLHLERARATEAVATSGSGEERTDNAQALAPWMSTIAAVGSILTAAAVAYTARRLGAAPELIVALSMMVVLGTPLISSLPTWGPAAAAAAALAGRWLADGAAVDPAAPIAMMAAAALASVGGTFRAAAERRVRDHLAVIERDSRSLAAANAAQVEASEVAEAVLAATRDISASVDAAEVATRVARSAYVSTHSAAAIVLLWDAEHEVFRVAAVAGGTTGADVQQLEVTLRGSALQRVLSEGLADVGRADVRDPVLDALMRRWKAGALLAARLQRGERLLGVVLAARRSTAPAPARDQRILGGIALQAAAALEIANLVNDLRSASALREEFTATMSHELRTPLNVIIGYTEMQREGMFGDLPEEHLDVLARVHEQSVQLLDLIQATLDVGRLERGLMTVDLRETSIHDLMKQLSQAIPPSWRKPHVQLLWRVDPAVPMIRSDAGKLQVAVRNLVHNALKFTDEGQVTVTATTDPSGQRVHIVVQDSGRGIAAKDLSVIFDMFRQSSERDASKGGVGLGLYIVKRLVSLLGGDIDVRSAPGRGSTFRIHLPVGGPHASHAAALVADA
jgi:signal transduction histidine kinase